MTKLVWHNIGRREYKPGIDHGLLYIQPDPIVEGVVVEQHCRETWEWDDFYASCELMIDGHIKHRWTYHDGHKGVDVVIEWESFWDELPETSWPCPSCNHLHKGKDENAENPHYGGNGACKETIVRETWAGLQNTKCYCSRRRPDKKEK